MRNLIEPATFLAKCWRHRKRNTFSTKTVSTGGLDHDVSEIRNGASVSGCKLTLMQCGGSLAACNAENVNLCLLKELTTQQMCS